MYHSQTHTHNLCLWSFFFLVLSQFLCLFLLPLKTSLLDNNYSKKKKIYKDYLNLANNKPIHPTVATTSNLESSQKKGNEVTILVSLGQNAFPCDSALHFIQSLLNLLITLSRFCIIQWKNPLESQGILTLRRPAMGQIKFNFIGLFIAALSSAALW